MSDDQCHTSDDVLDIIDSSIKRLATPTILLIASFLIYQSGAERTGISFFLYPVVFSVLMSTSATLIVGVVFITSMTKFWNLNIPKTNKQLIMLLYSFTYLMVAIVVITQAFIRLGGS